MVSRGHWADSVLNSVLRVDGMPEQRAKPDSAGLQQKWGNNLNHDSVGQDSNALIRDVDRDNTILEHHNHGGNLALDGLLDNLANNWVPMLTVDKYLEGRALWDNLGLCDAGKDLDNLLLAR